ncbi:hypothetical protein OE88DRAFT_1804774 [Heliocybe sulcata]|uniref:PIN domain-containing protein n=1 Tax=Heliocybe sulcata TaxID=5364 RepID=A0A5C3NFB5_9AGAM|nr:hypothetical protein OE88DRAFT_1804774 [Heliocybe sulcata]
MLASDGSFQAAQSATAQNIHSPISPSSPGTPYEDTYFRTTLENIEQVANEDVEMRVPLTSQTICLVLDTNVLLGHLDLIRRFTADIEQVNLSVAIIIPGIVVHELDSQKNRARLSWFARSASTWILEKFRQRKSVRGQSHSETCMPSGSWKKWDKQSYFDSGGINDDLILDCCLYFHERQGLPVVLCTGDHNLILKAQPQGIPALKPEPRLSSRQLARLLFGDDSGYIDLYRFSDNSTSFKPSTSIKKRAVLPSPQVGHQDDDAMEIDDANDGTGRIMTPYELEPSHAWDSLHLQIIRTFTVLLRELVRRVAGPDIARTLKELSGTARSLYAPEYTRKVLDLWTARDCLNYLDSKKPQAKTYPRVEDFLSMPYVGKGTGARPGHQWAARDWHAALDGLWKVSSAWEEGSIQEWLRALGPHLEYVLMHAPGRPVGC